MDDLKKFYEIDAGELDVGEDDPKPSAAYREATRKQAPARRIIRLGQEQARLDQQRQELDKLIEQAKIKEGEPPETPARLEALNALVNQFYKAVRVVRVKLTEPLMGADGKALRKFGMKALAAEPEKADRQFARLQADLEIAKRYFPNLELREITTRDNKRVAVLIGASAEEFNAVVAAEKTRQLWETQHEALTSELEKAHQELADMRKLRQAGFAANSASDKESDVPVVH